MSAGTNAPTRLIRVFLSSPSDVMVERTLSVKVIEQLGYEPEFRDKATFEVVAWDKPGEGTPLLAGMTPQEAVNMGLPLPSECDIVVIIFWARMGTPLPLVDYQKEDGTQYLSGTEWEYHNSVQASKEEGYPLVVLYRRTEDPVIRLNDPDRDKKIIQWERVQAFFDQFKNPDGSMRQGYNTYEQPDDFRQQLETHLRKLVTHILEKPVENGNKHSDGDTEFWEGSPFPGLRAFTPADAPIFFGRGREIDALVRRLSDPTTRFVAVVSASGSGKSSLIGAGLIPHLQANSIEGSKDWLVVTMKPGESRTGNPFDSLAEAFLRDAIQYKASLEQLKQRRGELSAMLSNRDDALERLGIGLLKEAPEWSQILLFIDQFEELFTVADETFREPFINMLVQLTTTEHFRIVVTLRSDFYAKCVDWPQLAELLETGTYPLALPKEKALHEMIARPAARARLDFEPNLPERILEETGSDTGALALMAYALDELYQSCRNNGYLTHKAYESFGGVQGAIGTRAEITFKTLDQTAREKIQEVFRELVEVDERGIATRRRSSLDRVTPTPAAKRLIDALTAARLLVLSGGADNQPVVEVAHEALLRSWPRLADWIEMTQDDLRLLRQVRQSAAEWQRSDHNKAFLWPHERLELVYAMLERLGQPILDDHVQQFITPEFDRLMVEINDETVGHFRRASIGDRLAQIGDNRPGVGLNENGLPDIAWCKITAGKVLVRDSWREAFYAKDFHIARYPITYKQYLAFVEADDGYVNPEWWAGLARRDEHPGTQNRPIFNHPADNISWYDAIAFCRWFSSHLGYIVRLPTGWEWQRAAAGPEELSYPWGNTWNQLNAVTRECGLSRTTAVGMFPKGISPFGALDMCGNVWEWCLNEYDRTRKQSGVSLSTALAGRAQRVQRGGSWGDQMNFATTYYRNIGGPAYRSHYTGFRVCTQYVKLPNTASDDKD